MRAGDMVTIGKDVIKKHNKTDKVYCKTGDKVKIIALHDEIAIVEGKERYSIHIKHLIK